MTITRQGGWVVSSMLVGGFVAACASGAARPAASTPPASASPEAVTRIYLHAAKAQDCPLTAALTLRNTWSWCRDPRLLDYRSVGASYPVSAAEAGRAQRCVQFEMYTHRSPDDGMTGGWQPWGLCFVHTHDGWRLYDQGQG